MWALIRSVPGDQLSQQYVILEVSGAGCDVWGGSDGGEFLELHLLAVGTREEMEAKLAELDPKKG